MGRLIAGTLLFWAVTAGGLTLLSRPDLIAAGLPALILCLVPAGFTLWWASSASPSNPERRLVAFLGGTLVRMGVVLGGALVLYFLAPLCHCLAFWIWVLAFYLFTLGLETTLVVSAAHDSSRPIPP